MTELHIADDLSARYDIGLDIGSTTTKAFVIERASGACVFSSYRRHFALQAKSVRLLLADIIDELADSRVRIAFSGSGGKAIAESLGLDYIQEVVANALAVQKLHPQARCAIELGGQDAKMIFFSRDKDNGALTVSDMRMNGSCAGGTGAFIDEIAALLKIDIEDLDACAARGTTVHDISGRCGVYAKTDIQPLLNQGAAKDDLALSTFHAIAKQTLGGLAQGLDITAPVIFEGGPLTFNPTLVRVFAEHLDLAGSDIIVPENPQVIVAQGAAFALSGMFAKTAPVCSLADVCAQLDVQGAKKPANDTGAAPFFTDPGDLDAFRARHALQQAKGVEAFAPGQTVHAYLGIDSGSTTTKFALVSREGDLIDSYYSSNEGEPLDIAVSAMKALYERYRAHGVTLQIDGCATTGYGEELFAKAFHADHHMVETVAHAAAATRYVPDASFVLDIGGQDMKALWLSDGIVTNIVVNEACSSGCGSFLQGFAESLHIPVEKIAAAAFDSASPAQLGSRCTVFMNSSVVTEQKNGKTPQDIMAGLCRSIIENVFTKVIRVSNLESLGENIVVQGGTFANDAVLAAFEAYIGKTVTRAPYPGLMGAIGAALLACERMQAENVQTTFIGFSNLDSFGYEQRSNVVCPHCGNACKRSVVTFADNTSYVTGNRCERGAELDTASKQDVRGQARGGKGKNLFTLREKLLFKSYDAPQLAATRNVRVGLPRVLALWDAAPFWTTFFSALGFTPVLSGKSTRAMYESGLSAVASDTVCFPAKLVHGHVRDLVAKGVDRIFMPIITTVPSENTEKTSQSMCAVVKGYPLVIRNSDNPQKRFGVAFDTPLFHWYTAKDRARQLSDYMHDEFGIAPELTRRAIDAGDAAMRRFRETLLEAGSHVIETARANGSYAVVLASRPYHNDALVNHDLADLFARRGVSVVTPDAVAGTETVDLSMSRLDIVNNFHARMLSSALIAARDDALEYVQVVSFGCGHDAYLSDEILRLMKEASGKVPLVLKVDESDATGPLNIRVRSFIETVNGTRAKRSGKPDAPAAGLPDPYPVKYEERDKKERVILVPNTSAAFSKLMACVFSKQGARAVPLEIGRERAIELGKRYVHNDICFPAQIVIGEALAELETGKYDNCEVAVGTGKYIGDCRLTHYAALLRKALDDAGYKDVPIITNDDVDYHDMHPGFKMNLPSAVRVAMALPMIDILEELLRKIRPYELSPGSAERAFDEALDCLLAGIAEKGTRGAKRGFKRALAIMEGVEYDRSCPRPTVLIVGEYLLNFHPGANHDIEKYLEDNGFEVIEARMTDVIRKTYFYKNAQSREFKVGFPKQEAAWYAIANGLFEHAHNVADSIARDFPLYTPVARMDQIVKASDSIIHHSFDAGEGVLIPAEILEHAKHGCRAFLILQPFGCLPNHIVGRGIAKRLKELYPSAQILPLDYDPDVSFANLENRLQMLIMNARREDSDAHTARPDSHDGHDGENASLEQFDNLFEFDLTHTLPESLAACADALASIDDILGRTADAIVADASTRTLSSLVSWSISHGDEVLARLKELSRRADDIAEHVNTLREKLSAEYDLQAGAAYAKLADLALKTSQTAASAAEAASKRIVAIRESGKLTREAAESTLAELKGEATQTASALSAQALELKDQLQALARAAA